MGTASINAMITNTPSESVEILAVSNTASSSAGAAGTTVLDTYTLPGGTPGPNDAIRITSLWSMTNNANNKIAEIDFGPLTNEISYSTCGSKAGLQTMTIVYNDNSVSAQKAVSQYTVDGSQFHESANANEAFTVDTTADVDITFKAEGMTASDNMILESYIIELLRAP